MKILFNAARLQITHTRTHALICARTHAHAHTNTHTTQLSAEGPDEPELKLHVLQFVHNVAGIIDLVSDLQGFHNKTTTKKGVCHMTDRGSPDWSSRLGLGKATSWSVTQCNLHHSKHIGKHFNRTFKDRKKGTFIIKVEKRRYLKSLIGSTLNG